MGRTLYRSNGFFYEPAPKVRYVLTSILQLAKMGEDLTIIDTKTKEDVTGEVLLRAIYHDSRNQTHAIPKALAYDILMNYNGNLAEFLYKKHKEYGPVKRTRKKKPVKRVTKESPPNDATKIADLVRLTRGEVNA